MKESISIIIPIYNVEKYLNRCIDSIINQTYINLEIILVDDGSTDNCPKICDEYAKKDSRIKVIHKKNGGVSSARNSGIINSSGEYIGFIDPDDYIEPTMYEELLYNLKKTNTKISMCGYSEVKNGKVVKSYTYNNQIISSEQAIKDMFNGTFMGTVCNKLFMKKLILNEKNILFNKNVHLWEDMLFLCEVLEPNLNISVCSNLLYNYATISSSICHSINEKKLSVLMAMDLIDKLCVDKFPNLIDDFKITCIEQKIRTLIELKQLSNSKDKNHILELEKFVKENLKYCNTKSKLKGLLAIYFPNIYILLKNTKAIISN